MPKPITFYDIASGPPIRPYAPNPCKTRLLFLSPLGLLENTASNAERQICFELQESPLRLGLQDLLD